MSTVIKDAHELYRPEDGWIETAYGRFDPKNPKFDIHDIAHNLGQLTRFNGSGRFFYSIAEHSVLVSNIMTALSLGDPFEGLMHDDTEFALSDVPAPFKQLLPDWRAFDAELELALRRQYNLPPKKSQGCKKADWLALFIEAYYLLPSRGAIFSDPLGLRDEALSYLGKFEIHGWDDRTAERKYLFRYFQLTNS